MDSFERYVGQVLDKRYRMLRVLGVGGMAVVFEANDLLMRRNVAVKMLKDEIANDSQSVKRFINESKAVAMLSHPNIVNIYDVSVKDDSKYIVMELVDGITLKKYIQKKGSLSFHEIVSITEQILLALEHAHSKGIVHRDIKPQNIMILKNGVVKVADFGIAKLPNAETLTMTDKAIGTVFYISPEQASGKTIDARSDIYSLGATMYEMATGKLPFMADSPVSVALMQVKNAPKPPRELNPAIPVGLEQIILCAMEKNPANRFQNATGMLGHISKLKSNPQAVFKFARKVDNQPAEEGGGSLPPNVKKLNPKKASRSMFPVIAGVTTAFFIVCCVSAVVVLTKLFDTSSSDLSKQITVPKLVDAIYTDELKAQLESQYYEIETEIVYDTDAARNVIIAQNPTAGEKRKVIPDKQLCKLKLTISWGPETLELEDYSYKDARSAEIEIRELGLTVEVIKEEHEFISEGCVIRTEPEPGTTVTCNPNTKITLYVSSGQDIEYISMPDFYKLNEKAVMTTLGWYKLELGDVTREHSEAVAEGCVISQNIPVDAKVPVGTKVNLVMSLGPKAVETTADVTADTVGE